MARNPEYESLYAAFQEFLDRCIIGDHSLLWPDTETWTAANVGDVRKRMVDKPLAGSTQSFQEKLQEQMHGAGPELWRIVCDLYFVYFLGSRSITPQKKHEDLRWAAAQGGLTLPPRDDDLWERLELGCVRTGLKYNYKYAQFWLLLLFAERVKAEPDRAALARDPDRMQQLLDGILQGIPSKTDRAYDMRHAILHLAFPEQYERIISTHDKMRIVETFYRKVVGGSPPADLDAALRAIRERLQPTCKPGQLLDFYETELRRQWAEGVSAGGGQGGGSGGGANGSPDGDEDVHAILSALQRSRNVILYGPPGTGKTYLAKRAAEALVAPQTLSAGAVMQKAIEGLTLHEVLALGMYQAGPGEHYSVAEINQLPIVAQRMPASRVRHPRNTIWNILLTHTPLDSKTVKTTLRREPYLFDKDALSRWFLTDSGREYVKENLGPELIALGSVGRPAPDPSDFVEWTTFHQSYSYEDFVEGLRPRLAEESSEGVAYEIVPGVFRLVCERASKDPGNKYVLVIDEINRGNIAKIFGELITLLEDDKRAGEANALAVTLPYSQEQFSVPSNLYIIGTMNSTDRSIALLDTALRRRFAFIELMPRPELLRSDVVESSDATVPLDGLLCALNGGLRKHLDRDHQVGHSYLLKVARAPAEQRTELLEFVWRCQILPLLQEYFYSQPDRLAELLSPMLVDAGSGPEGDRAAAVDPATMTGEDLMAGLARLARTGLPEAGEA